MNKTQLIRLKSDNYDCYVAPEVYEDITLTMSSGDYGAHIAKVVFVDSNQLEDIRWHKGIGLIDKGTEIDDMDQNEPLEVVYYFYDGHGDCNIEISL
jgi:hypothetical protein